MVAGGCFQRWIRLRGAGKPMWRAARDGRREEKHEEAGDLIHVLPETDLDAGCPRLLPAIDCAAVSRAPRLWSTTHIDALQLRTHALLRPSAVPYIVGNDRLKIAHGPRACRHTQKEQQSFPQVEDSRIAALLEHLHCRHRERSRTIMTVRLRKSAADSQIPEVRPADAGVSSIALTYCRTELTA